MDELSPEARRVLMAARADAGPTAGDRARVQAMIIAAIAMPAASAAAATSVGGKVGAGATSGLLAKLGAAALVTSLTVVGGYAAYNAYTSKSRTAVARQLEPNVTLQSPAATVTPSVTTPSVDAAAPSSTSTSVRSARSNAARSARRPSHSSTPERSAQVANEILWISSAESALDKRAPALALQALQQHARLFPQGELRQERLGLRAIALCTLNGVASTTQVARTYLTQYPSSILAERVRDACRVAPARGDK